MDFGFFSDSTLMGMSTLGLRQVHLRFQPMAQNQQLG
jgi:hypothetical protein